MKQHHLIALVCVILVAGLIYRVITKALGEWSFAQCIVWKEG